VVVLAHLEWGHTLAGPAHHCFSPMGSGSGLGLFYGGILHRFCMKGRLLCLFPLRISALRLLFAPFGMFSTCIRICDLQNMFSRIQVELGQ
jgi:hypothetical protein